MEAEESPKGWLNKYAVFFGAAFSLGIAYFFYSVEDVSSDVQQLSSLIFRSLDPATARALYVWLAQTGYLPKDFDKDDPYLCIEPVPGLHFMTPVGLSVGFDPGASGVNGFINLGFGAVEVGPVGGADCAGAESAALWQQLVGRDRSPTGAMTRGLVGVVITIGSAQERDIVGLVATLGPHVNYVALELASLPPALCRKAALQDFVAQVVQAAVALPDGGPRVFLRVPPRGDTCPFMRVAQSDTPASTGAPYMALACAACAGGGADGLIARLPEPRGGEVAADDEAVCSAAVDAVSEAYRLSEGRLILIAAGGIRNGRDAMNLVTAGASSVQISSLLLSEGPQACRRIKSEMSQCLMDDSYVNLVEAVGASFRKKRHKKKNIWKVKGGGSK